MRRRHEDPRHVPAGDGHGLVGVCVGSEEQRSLEAGLYLPDAAEIDQEPAVDAKEPLAFELLFEPVEATSGGPQRSLIGPQPNIVAVGLRKANLAGIKHDPPVVSHGDHSKMVKRPSCDATNATESRWS